MRKPIDLAAVGGLRLLGEFRYELTFRFPMALYLDETCGTVESTFTLVYKSTGLPESGAEFKRICMLCIYVPSTETESTLKEIYIFLVRRYPYNLQKVQLLRNV